MVNKYSLKSVSVIFSVLGCLITVTSCSEEPEALAAPQQSNSSVELIITKNNVPSDNYTYAEIGALTKFRPNANDIIVFNADKGVFSNNSSTYSVNVSSNDTTRAFLKYNKAELVRVTATVYNKYSKEVFVNFLTSFPTKILVSPDSSTLQPLFKSKCNIKSLLSRQTGNVSERLQINYYDSVATSNGGSIGTFHNSTYSNPQGESTVVYWLQDTSYRGFVFIKSYIDTDKGRIIGVNKIFIRK